MAPRFEAKTLLVRSLGLWLMGAAIAAFALLKRGTGIAHIPEVYTSSIMGLIILYAGFQQGLRFGLLCAVLAVGFLLWDLSIPAGPFQYPDAHVEALISIPLAYVGALWLAAAMRDRLERTVRLEADRAAAMAVAEELRVANAELHGLAEQLTARNEAIEAVVAQRTRELAGEKALLDRIIRHVPAAVVFLDAELRIRWLNETFAEIAHQSVDALIGRPFHEVMPQPAASPGLETLLQTHEPQRATGLAFTVQRDGREVMVHMDHVYVPLLSGGSLEGVLLFAVDVSDRVENERLQREQILNLQEVDRLKGDFINVASHELRTPLTSIRGYAEFLEDQVAGPLVPDQLEFVSQIQEGARRLQRIVDDMLDFARLEAGTFALVWQEASLGHLIQEELSSLAPQLQVADLSLELRLASEANCVRMDPRRIGQVLLNLVGNAVKFTPPGGSVTVRSQVADGRIRVEVTDSGIGIPAESMPRLFEKFYQVDPSSTRTYGGAGLGLAISRAIVEGHGGEIGVTSEPGRGSTFWFTLPLVPQASVPSAALPVE